LLCTYINVFMFIIKSYFCSCPVALEHMLVPKVSGIFISVEWHRVGLYVFTVGFVSQFEFPFSLLDSNSPDISVFPRALLLKGSWLKWISRSCRGCAARRRQRRACVCRRYGTTELPSSSLPAGVSSSQGVQEPAPGPKRGR